MIGELLQPLSGLLSLGRLASQGNVIAIIDSAWFWGALAAVLVMWLVLFGVDRWNNRVRQRAPTLSIFDKLCNAHHLSGAERQELQRIADLTAGSQSASVFLRPDFVRSGCQQLRMNESQARHLMVRLFGEEMANLVAAETSSGERTPKPLP